MMPVAAATNANPTKNVANVSNLPCPYSCDLSCGFELMLTKAMTMMSVRKSESECTASAIIAALFPSMPAMNLNVVNATFPADPTNVTL